MGVKQLVGRPDRVEWIGAATMTAALLVVTGCDSGPQLAPVSGKVVFNGKPLEFGTVMFQPEQGGQPAVGQIHTDGTFVMSTFEPGDGAVVGPNAIRVTCYTSQNPDSTAPPGDYLGDLLIPRKYTIFTASGLTAVVPEDGLNTLQLELEGKRRR